MKHASKRKQNLHNLKLLFIYQQQLEKIQKNKLQMEQNHEMTQIIKNSWRIRNINLKLKFCN